ncbi:inositol 2-dehydrogenase [Caballeronia hypogeia]|uniref:Inositol 2-dehydrogenase n=1 Tax=Caballeronia hypogeia TaxID=1777140 RepID=A0A158AQR1_9BURK|nr:Gfo/Idh/MocA family oxidoreductase [Caballeronia hypogeia]SAK60059.1 inositol 2-dehydrogenase [Caballeronia hypogeia]
MTGRINIAVIGAGVIGKRHVHEIAHNDACRLAAIADPTPEAAAYADTLNVPYYCDYREALARGDVDAAIVCTPNHTHLEVGLACIGHQLPLLMEKPIADDIDSARKLADAATAVGVALLVGHHRRHNPSVRAVKEAIEGGRIGKLVMANIMCLMYKPDAYFEVPWRRQPGGGPVLINLIHEIDLLRHLCGEIVAVQAVASNGTRGHEVEDSAACTLTLANGALANISLSDTTSAPWSWETTAGEDRALFDYRPVPTHFFAGTDGALTLPDLALWSYRAKKGRDQPIQETRLPMVEENVYAAQLRHFLDVVRGDARPVIDGHDAARTLAATLAVVEAARTARPATPLFVQ